MSRIVGNPHIADEKLLIFFLRPIFLRGALFVVVLVLYRHIKQGAVMLLCVGLLK
jgi:hypothetical protein